MRCLDNNNGFALVTSLMLTLLSLVIVMSLLYMITQGTKVSGLNKKYKTALEASYGGTELFTKDILPFVMRNYSSTTLVTDLVTTFGADRLSVGSQSCLQAKLKNATLNWPAVCGNNNSNPKDRPDVTYTMQATSGNPFLVYSKIVDTVIGNSDLGGLQLEGAGVAESLPVITPQHFPYIYRVEIQGERQSNAGTQANLEVLYAY
ncbi:MAG: hypothetical protein JJE30_16760 [Desulfuromonadales bacterium]|nr:hypothetical protein [Desulfuromonadales bacterium]